MGKGKDRNEVVGKLAMKPDTGRWKDSGAAASAGAAATPPEGAPGVPAGGAPDTSVRRPGGKRMVANCQAALLLIDGRLVLREVDLPGKIMVNGTPITQVRLKEGDYLQLGEFELYVAEASAGGAKKPQASSSSALLRSVTVVEEESAAAAAAGAPAAASPGKSGGTKVAGKSASQVAAAEAAALLLPQGAGGDAGQVTVPDDVTQDDSAFGGAGGEDDEEGRGGGGSARVSGSGADVEEVDESEFEMALSGANDGLAGAPKKPASFFDQIPPERRRLLAVAGAFLAVFFLVGFLMRGPVEEEPAIPTLGEMLETGLVDFEKNDFESAIKAFDKAKKTYESKLPKMLIELAKQFRDETDLSKFDWKGAQTRLRDIQAVEEASEGVKKFAKDKLAWMAREEQASGLVSQAMDFAEKDAWENALALYESLVREFPQSDSQIMIQGEVTKWRGALRKKYVDKADQILGASDPNWTEAINQLQKAAEFAKQQDGEITGKIENCQKNLKAKKDLGEVLNLFDQGLYQDAIDGLEKIKPGSFYDRAIANLRDKIVIAQKYAKGIKAYRLRDLRLAKDTLSGVSDKRCQDLLAKINAVEAGLEQGRRLLGLFQYRDAMKSFAGVMQAEPDQQTSYYRDAAEGFRTCRMRMTEQSVASFARAESDYEKQAYGSALDNYQKAIEFDETGQLIGRLKTRILADADKMWKEIHNHFVTSSTTQADYHALQLLVTYLDRNHKVWNLANEKLKGAPTRPNPRGGGS